VLRKSRNRRNKEEKERRGPRHLDSLHGLFDGDDNLTSCGGGAAVEKIANGIRLPVVFAMCDSAHHVDFL
jgi:hypothetical protein